MITSAAPEIRDFIFSSLPPSPAQKRAATAFLLVLIIVFAITVRHLATIPLGRVDPFIAANATAMLVSDSLTAVLLLAQFSILRCAALLVMASGYLYTGLMVLLWLLTFPGMFAPAGLLGGGLPTMCWVYILWHTVFPVFVLSYALLKDGNAARWRWRAPKWLAILWSVAVPAVLVCGAAILAAAGHDLPPRVHVDIIDHASSWPLMAAASGLSVLALLVLWAHRRSVLDLWLMVAMCAFVIEIILLSLDFPRFSVGWYTGRAYGLLSAAVVLIVLLVETTTLYARLLSAVLAERRERDARIMTGDTVSASIAHDVSQPLAAMMISAGAAFRWLQRAPPDLGEARAALEQIRSDGHRAGTLVQNIRAVFKKDAQSRTSLDLNDLIEGALKLMAHELQAHSVSVRTDLLRELPPVMGDRVRLQQVLLNLLTNAIDSMSAGNGERVLHVTSGIRESTSVIVSIEDTGSTLEPGDAERGCLPLSTAHAKGRGMGLAICRSIVEAHDGRLWVMPGRSQGAAFHIILPIADSRACALV
jgi:signal transduction histidine kinase